MFTAVRVAALTAIVALGGVFALAITTGGPAPSAPGVPDASAPTDAAYVTGEDGQAVLSWRYITTTEGDLTHLREGVVTLTSEMSDLRASGDVTFAFSVDVFPGDAGVEWGTMRIENDGGAWTGPCAGGSKPNGNPYAASCWLTGSGDYEGYTYYRQHVWGGNLAERAITEGLIFPGVPPTEYPELPTPASE